MGKKKILILLAISLILISGLGFLAFKMFIKPSPPSTKEVKKEPEKEAKLPEVFVQEGQNLINNAGFEQGTEGWGLWVEGMEKPSDPTSGNSSAQITTGSTAPQGWGRVACVTQGSAYGPTNPNFSNSSLFAGKQFKLSGYIKTTSGTSAYFKLSVHTSGGSWNPNWSPGTTGNVSSTSWQYVEKTFTIPSNVDGIYLDGCSAGSAGGKTWFDYLRLTRVDNGQNLVNDSGFETGTSNWGLWSEAQGTAYQSEYKLNFVAESPIYKGEVVSGGYSGKSYQITTGIDQPKGWGRVACVTQGSAYGPTNPNFSNSSLFAGKQFKLSGYIKTTSGTSAYFKLSVHTSGGSWNPNWSPGTTGNVSSTSWQYVEKTFTIPSNVDGIYLDGCSAGAMGGQAWFDDISLVELVAEVCTPGQKRCSGNTLQQCNSTRTGWDNIQTCQYGCENNACKGTPVICTAGQKRCSGNILQQCNSAGTTWTNIQTCQYGCENNACKGVPVTGLACQTSFTIAAPSPSPSPSPSPFVSFGCTGLEPQPSAPLPGQELTFTCIGLAANTTINHFNFRVNNGTATKVNPTQGQANQATFTYTVPATGESFTVECQVCTSSDDSNCTTWGEAR